MTASPAASLASASEWVQRGQSLESAGAAGDALACYDRAIALLSADDPSHRLTLGVAWMNRGHALQQFNHADQLVVAVEAYAVAITHLRESAPGENESARNSLGAAWMNHGQLLHRLGRLEEALASLETAAGFLSSLPTHASPAFRHNFAGTHVNRANVLIDLKRNAEARDPAVEALRLTGAHENLDFSDAQIALMARRALCAALGQLAFLPGADQNALAFQVGDLVDDGLALMHRWEARAEPRLRPLALRLFRFGARVYAMHQPHFLVEFLSENLIGPLAEIPEWRKVAMETIDTALRKPPTYLIVGDPVSERWRQTAGELQAARRRLAESLPPQP